MRIEIELKTSKGEPSLIHFPIMLKGLEEAMNDTYLDLGTSYRPIVIDNFVTIEPNDFPEITQASTISITLKKEDDDSVSGLKKPVLVCCKAKNVGKDFVNREGKLEDQWDTIFKCNSKWIQCTPDGALYVSPNKQGACVIKTKKSTQRNFISYSILFSMILENNETPERKFYFNLDPLVKISSRN